MSAHRRRWIVSHGISSDSGGRRIWRFGHEAMATRFEILAVCDDGDYARAAADAVFDEVDRLEGELSRFVPTSDVSHINALSAGESVRVGIAVFECLRLAAKVWADTAGAFDVTIGSVLLHRRAKAPGMGALELDEAEHVVRVRADGVAVDLGGIGKGYAVDRMAELLREWSLTQAIVHGGQSTVFALEPPPGRRGWPVSLRDPHSDARVWHAFDLRKRALSGSGTTLHGAHIIDPRTGRPASRTQAAWALAPTAALADALSTAFVIMSSDEIARYVKRYPNVAAGVLRSGETEIERIGTWPA